MCVCGWTCVIRVCMHVCVCVCVDEHVCNTCMYACVCVVCVYECMHVCVWMHQCLSVFLGGGGVYIHACIIFVCLGIVYGINPEVANLKILKRLSHAGETVSHKITYILTHAEIYVS